MRFFVFIHRLVLLTELPARFDDVQNLVEAFLVLLDPLLKDFDLFDVLARNRPVLAFLREGLQASPTLVVCRHCVL